MSIYLFLLIFSTLIHFVLFLPFINFLYQMKMQRAAQKTKDIFNKSTPIFDKFNKHKAGTPVGGGLLIIICTIFLFPLGLLMVKMMGKSIISNYPSLFSEIKILLFTFISFSFLGLWDDLKKIFFWKEERFFGMRFRHKLIIQILLSLIIGYWIWRDLDVAIIHIPFLGVWDVGVWYIVFAAFVICAFANAVNITDGLDGLASGVLIITLLSFWAISSAILDTPLLVFLSLWIGGLAAFAYFNIHPARIILGDTGALSFGATFAVIGLLLGKIFALPIIGGIFIIEIASSAFQLLSKKFFHRKLFPVAPVHLLLQHLNWEEPKIVMRAWILTMLCAAFGLMVALIQ